MRVFFLTPVVAVEANSADEAYEAVSRALSIDVTKLPGVPETPVMIAEGSDVHDPLISMPGPFVGVTDEQARQMAADPDFDVHLFGWVQPDRPLPRPNPDQENT